MVSRNRFYLIFGVLFALSVLARGRGNTRGEGRGNGQVNGRANGRGNGPPDDVLEKQRERLSLKPGKKLKPEKVENDQIKVGGKAYSLRREDLVPLQPPISRSTVFMINGKEKTRPPQSNLFTSKEDPSVLLVFGQNGELKRASKGHGAAKKMVVPVDDDPEYFVEYSDDDWDYDELNKKYTLEDAVVPPEGASRSLSLRRASPKEATAKRELQGGCTEFEQIDIAIAFDSYFCDDNGGESGAIDRVYEVVLSVSGFYAVDDICFSLVVSTIDGFCGHTNTDPYKAMVDSTPNIGCGGEGLLDEFQDYWNANRPQASYPRDTSHLFYGKKVGTTNTIGCAYINVICNTNWGYGVNQMTSNLLNLHEQLFAHELGHNVGSNHDGSCSNTVEFIMCPSINSATIFSSQSKAAFEANTSGSSCLTTVAAGPTDTPTIPPTLRPTNSPTNSPTKTPTKSPTKTPTKAPVAPNETPSPVSPTSPSPTKSPTESPTASPVTPSSDVLVTFYIAFDYWPEDSGFKVTAVDDETDEYYNVPTGTWANAPSFGAASVEFYLPANQDFTLHFYDAWGDGIGWYANGWYGLFWGTADCARVGSKLLWFD